MHYTIHLQRNLREQNTKITLSYSKQHKNIIFVHLLEMVQELGYTSCYMVVYTVGG